MHSAPIRFSVRATLVAGALMVVAAATLSQANAQSQTVNYSASVTVQNTFSVGG